MATARHPKATFFVQRHLFSGLTSFAGLEQKIAVLPDEQSRGAAFEVFAEAYLATQRKWADAHHQKTGVWPNRNSGDVLGAPGETWAIVAGSLFKGRRSLPGGSSSAKLLAEKRASKLFKPKQLRK